MAYMPQDTLQPDMAEHYETYSSFVKYTALFVLHVAIILALLAYFLV